ncbi:hemerythrin domain-containing protein [Actinomycetes bacterium KLBMP 9797]
MASDAVTLIKNDHRVMEQLFEQMLSRKGDRTALLKECIARLSAHSWAEEEKVYPAIVQADPPEEGQVYHGVEEHHEAEQLMHKLEEIDPASAEFDSTLVEFVEAVKHHVEEEETKILPALAESVDRIKLEELGAAFEERRMAVLSEHGYGADMPPGASAPARKVGGSAAGGGKAGATKTEKMTKEELYQQAKKAAVPGRSTMTKEELAKAVRKSGP